jgi:D-alanine-D-alanine ligase
VPKLRVGILFGGRSTEHEVSVVSATTVMKALDPARYTPVLIAVDQDGSWRVAEPEHQLLPETVFTSGDAVRSFPTLRETLAFLAGDGTDALAAPLDVVFPIIHGRGGEDGSLQGMLELAGMPYVGPAVLGTALCMDKALSKRALRDAGLPVLPYAECSRHDVLQDPERLVREVEERFAYPVFVKPTNTGSSVGVKKATTRVHLVECIKEAARYDLDVLVEPAANAREVECAVLGGHDPQASVLGEIIAAGEFYDYEAKYVSDDTRLVIPAELPENVSEQMRRMAVAAFRVLKCWGMARVDFFIEKESGRVLLNELNTLPGFTEVSMYPRLWEASGISLPHLVDRLIELALERQREQSSLETRFTG